jgi:hypothetical protein
MADSAAPSTPTTLPPSSLVDWVDTQAFDTQKIAIARINDKIRRAISDRRGADAGQIGGSGPADRETWPLTCAFPVGRAGLEPATDGL